MPYKRTIANKKKWQAIHQRTLEDGSRKRLGQIFDTKAEALEWEAAVRKIPLHELFPELNPVSTTPMVSLTVLEWATKYLAYVETSMGTETFYEKRVAFRTLIEQVGPTFLVKDLTKALVHNALLVRMRDVSGNAANRDRKNLKAAWQYGLDFIDVFPKDMAEPFPRRKMAETRNDRYIPPEDDFWKVVEVATGQDRVMLLTYFALAARRSEVYRLQLKDLDFKRDRVRLYTRKRENGTEEFDWLPMKGSLRKELNAHVERKNISDPEAYVFANDLEHSRYKGSRYGKRKYWMKTLCMKAGVPYFTLHAIRHITPSILDDQGESLKTIQKIMRHKSPETTLKYLHQMRPERDALERLEIKVPT